MAEKYVSDSVMMNGNTSIKSQYIRDMRKTGFDAAAFHYTIYRSLKRFLGLVTVHR